MSRESILNEIAEERIYQEAKWGTTDDDVRNQPNDWVSYISHYATKWFPGAFSPYRTETVNDFRTKMVKVAALAVAAIESLDRQRAAHGSAFYEKK